MLTDAVPLFSESLSETYRHRFDIDPDIYVLGRNLEAGRVQI